MNCRKDLLDLLPVPGRIKTYLNTPFYYSEQVILVNFKLGPVFSLWPSHLFVFCIIDKGMGSKLTIRLRTSMFKRKILQKLESKMQN